MHHITGYQMVGVDAPLKRIEREVEGLDAGEVLVEVAGCGICHTDLGFLFEGVRTRQPTPLILGHEISGRVVDAGEGARDWVGQAVIVPAVIPCGSCDACRAGRPMICPRQIMPGNDRDGGFATHVVVPALGLCPVPGAPDDFDAPLPGGSGLTLRHLAVIADAVSTPYQAIARAGLGEGDLCVVVGLGGVGGYAAQIAAALGAHVVGLDVDERKLATAESLGVGLALDPRSEDPRALRQTIRSWAKAQGAPSTRWTLMECSGSAAGQRTAFGLLVHGATLMVVGFTRDKLELRLSNLMAFDARAIGTWGCDPDRYPEILRLVLDGRLDLLSRTELRPLADVAEALDDVRAHRTERRLVLAP